MQCGQRLLSVGPDLGSNCLQMLSVDKSRVSKERFNHCSDFLKKTYYGQVYVMSEHQICGSGCIFTRSDPCRNSSLMLIHGVLALNILTL